MSTRATIAYRRDDDRYAAVYLHFDGYPDHTGKVLEGHFNTLDAAQALVDGGDLRSLTPAGDCERYSDGNRPAVMPTPEALIAFALNCGANYLYVFEGRAWTCRKLH